MTFAINTLLTAALGFIEIENDSLWLYLIGVLGTVISVIFLVTKALVDKKPFNNLLDKYKKNPKFSELKLEIDENNKIVGKINNLNIELIPYLIEGEGINFKLTIDLSNKPYHNNDRNLKNAFGKQKFEQEGSKIILCKWKPKILNYGKFDKVIDKLQELINKIENKTSHNTTKQIDKSF